jgi:hypothetical protein
MIGPSTSSSWHPMGESVVVSGDVLGFFHCLNYIKLIGLSQVKVYYFDRDYGLYSDRISRHSHRVRTKKNALAGV